MVSDRLSATGLKFTITISRQMGSLGREVGRLAAEQLGFRLVWRELINQAAIRSGSPEGALAAIDELGLLGICPSTQACHAYRQAVKQVIEELAGEGNVVIIGRAGQAILSGRPDVLHVRVVAPVELRSQRVAEQQGIPTENASAQVRASDQARRKYLRRFYQLAWDQQDLYDLTISTASISAAAAATLIAQAVLLRLEEMPAMSP